MSLILPTVNLQRTTASTFNQKYLEYDFNRIKSKLVRLPLMMCLLACSLFFSQNAQAQTYGETVIFGNANEYSFDYTLVCGSPPTTAILTVNFTAPPPGIVPQIHLGAGAFVTMTGSGPYTYTFTGLTNCDFSFQFWLAYAGGLYSSPFMTPANTPLPISLSNFSATKRGDRTAILDWRTSTEINSDYFGIERSIDGTNWEEISQVKAAGNSNTEQSYSCLDSDLGLQRTSDGVFYYRLKMTDMDGTFKYSGLRGVQFAKNNNSIVSIFPNPITNRINVDLTNIDMQAGNVQVSMYNALGREIMIKNVVAGGIELFDVTNFPPASYYVIVKQGAETISQTNIIKID